jgi:hypothetical protein
MLHSTLLFTVALPSVSSSSGTVFARLNMLREPEEVVSRAHQQSSAGFADRERVCGKLRASAGLACKARVCGTKHAGCVSVHTHLPPIARSRFIRAMAPAPPAASTLASDTTVAWFSSVRSSSRISNCGLPPAHTFATGCRGRRHRNASVGLPRSAAVGPKGKKMDGWSWSSFRTGRGAGAGCGAAAAGAPLRCIQPSCGIPVAPSSSPTMLSTTWSNCCDSASSSSAAAPTSAGAAAPAAGSKVQALQYCRSTCRLPSAVPRVRGRHGAEVGVGRGLHERLGHLQHRGPNL